MQGNRRRWMSDVHHAATSPVGAVVILTFVVDAVALLTLAGLWPLCVVIAIMAAVGFCLGCFFSNNDS